MGLKKSRKIIKKKKRLPHGFSELIKLSFAFVFAGKIEDGEKL